MRQILIVEPRHIDGTAFADHRPHRAFDVHVRLRTVATDHDQREFGMLIFDLLKCLDDEIHVATIVNHAKRQDEALRQFVFRPDSGYPLLIALRRKALVGCEMQGKFDRPVSCSAFRSGPRRTQSR